MPSSRSHPVRLAHTTSVRRGLCGIGFFVLPLMMAAGALALPLHPERAGTMTIQLGETEGPLEPRLAADGSRVWSWSWGVLIVSKDAPVEPIWENDVLSFAYGAELEGHAASGRVRFVEGRSRFKHVVLLRDNFSTLALASGVILETGASALHVRRDPLSGDAQTGLVMFLGMMMVTGLLLWNSRRRMGSQ